MNKLVKVLKLIAIVVLCSYVLCTPFGHRLVYAATKLTFALASGIWGAAHTLIG